MKRSPILPVLAVFALSLLIPGAAAAASSGTLNVSASGAPKLAKSAKRNVTVRAVNLATGAVISATSPRKASTKLNLAPGGYLVALRVADVPGKSLEASSKLLLVKAGRTTKTKLKLKALKKPRKAAAFAASGDGIFAPAEETAGKLIVGIDPNLVIRGVRGYDQGLSIDSMIATGLSGGCDPGEKEMLLVEIRRRAEILEELQRANDPRFDPDNVVKPGRLLRERQMVRGQGSMSGSGVKLHLVIVDLASGKELAAVDAKGGKRDFFDVVEKAVKSLKEEICKPKESVRVDVTFSGSGSYSRDEGTDATDKEDHIRADYSWNTEYRGVSLGPDGGLNFATASTVSGTWTTDGRYGAEGPGNYHCSAPVVGNSGTFATVAVTRADGRVKLTAQPYLSAMGDVFATNCTGLPGPPYASYSAFGNHASRVGVVEFDPASISGVATTFAVSPQASLAADCSDMVTTYELPCLQVETWSGTLSVARSK